MLDLLVLAPHPDDGELGCGGTLARAKAEGLSTGILDLTRGEMGSKGIPEEREKEVAEASRILGLDFRGNLGFPDGGLADVLEQRLKLAQALRWLRPRVLLAPLGPTAIPTTPPQAASPWPRSTWQGLRRPPWRGSLSGWRGFSSTRGTIPSPRASWSRSPPS